MITVGRYTAITDLIVTPAISAIAEELLVTFVIELN